ncbi:ankyrin repeat and death domain-containing protein 1B isoform X2 [Cyprinus carpio]|uniref:Ankyrin repeat and death domain-containing protein 1B isoform X2 n=1 Tax=Cyprinus carpio TaxID=7962 RepID=A0A9R0A0J9_CYPCA|nr:ankyrin repeat and death domain-containing protein 1B isoform X2 [Cyprinus carpio]
MERKAQAIKDCILKQPVWKNESLHPKTWLKLDHVKGFTEFILPKDIAEDGGYDSKEMLLEVEKDFIEAAKRNDVECMKLLGRGVNVNSKNVHGRTALHYAVAFRNVEAVDVLLRRRAKLDLQDKHGLTAVHLAAWFGSLEILKLLVQAGADQSIENMEGLNMMHCAAMNNHTDIVAYIVEDLQMGELDKEDQRGNRLFALAAAHGCVRMLQMLMEEPYNMATMEENKVGDTPLHLAAKNGQCEALQLLLDNFDIRNEVNQAGQTALYLAADGAHEDCVQTLLEAQCDPNIFTLSRSSPLHPVCERGHFPIVKLLISSGAQMNAQNQHLHTPLHLAVKNCHIPVIHTLLEAGCDPNVKDHMGQTALHIAAEMGKVDVVEMILKAGVDLEIQDRQNKTALGVAARGNMVIIVDMIIKAERYFRWKHDFQMNNTDDIESLHSESPLTFKLDHAPDTKPVRDIIWDLAYKHLKRNDWKTLAEFWEFTDDQVAAIEEQWTGPNSFQEHGNRMLLIWLHGIMIEGSSPAKGLYEALLSVGITKIAEKIRMEGTNTDARKCTVS